jgi:hypothetical protein
MSVTDFSVDLARQKPAEAAVAQYLNGTLTEGNVPYDIVLTDGRRVEVKTEVSYFVSSLRNFYFEVCDIPDGVPLPKRPLDVVGTHHETGIFRAVKHDVSMWIHGFRIDETHFHYFVFDALLLHARVIESLHQGRSFTGKPIRNKRWKTLGCAIPLKEVAPLIRGMFVVEAAIPQRP